MACSKYDRELTYNVDEWVVSLINTKKGLSSVFGGHVKIVVEGLTKTNNYPFYKLELFIGEYHIMEAERIPEETWIPQCLRNTTCKYIVLFKEDKKYTRQDEEYAAIQSRSHGGIAALEVKKMIQKIKEEQQSILEGKSSPNFQYAGEWCIYGLDGAHNCTTWAEDKLKIIGLDKHLITDSTKAMPFLHVNTPESIGWCNLL